MLGVYDDTFVQDTTDLLILELSNEAYQLFRHAHDRYGNEKVGMPADIKGFWSKQAGRIARLAGVLHAVNVFCKTVNDRKKIDAETMQAAITIGDWYGSEARRIYPAIGFKSETEFESDSREIINTIKQIGTNVTQKHIYDKLRKYRGEKGRKRLNDLLKKMADDDMLEIVENKATNGKKVQYIKML
jgi:hypothetical protein